ncbi:MAG: HAD family hydrolase [Candidatus Marsarchaeota archaeon]|nr:HAD family hydrolase [Candidatus Marsarchaeota archaeon]
MKIVLFDIDGTLLQPEIKFSDGVPMRSLFTYSMKKVFGADTTLPKDISGWTDRGVFLYLIDQAGISRSDAEQQMDRLIDTAIGFVRERIETAQIKKTEGIDVLLEAIKSKGYPMGLLTGNIPEIARLKLTKAGIYKYFGFGGFGTISDIRHRLIDHAINEAESRFGKRISRRGVFYFGDAVRDVEAGKFAGVVTIAVATGTQPVGQLEGAHPDYLLKDLSDTTKVIGIIDGRQSNAF